MNFEPSYLSNHNLNTNHPLQVNSDQYEIQTKYISIHSEDRNYIQFPNASNFEITLPQNYENVVATRISDWTFPSNYNTFSTDFENVELIFTINNPFQPDSGLYPIEYDIYTALLANTSNTFSIIISEGFYSPCQMVTEIQNKMNFIIETYINNYYNITTYTYSRFKVVYNEVQQNIWFGNTADQFILNNSQIVEKIRASSSLLCQKPKSIFSKQKDYSNYGLPSYIGLPKNDIIALDEIAGFKIPRFFYGDVEPGDNGYWLLPNTAIGVTNVFWIKSPNKINFMGPSYLYIDMGILNSIDELYPFYLSEYALINPENNGRTNSSVAKVAISATPISQYFNNNMLSNYKYHSPPLESLRKIQLGIRYHNNTIPDFGLFNWAVTVELTILKPKILRKGTVINGNTGMVSTNYISKHN